MSRAAVSCVILLVVASAGCTPRGKAHVLSRKRPDYLEKVDRVLLAVRLDRLGESFEKACKERLVEALRARGTEARLAVLEGDLAVEQGPSLEKQARDFRASSVLSVTPAGGVLGRYDFVERADFAGELFDLQLKRPVWRAQISYWPNDLPASLETRADVLVNEIIAALISDGLVDGPPPGVASGDQARAAHPGTTAPTPRGAP